MAPVQLQSCEISGDVNIKAHIEGQPKSARPEYFYASLNGSAAEMLHCDQVQVIQGSNYSFNCTLRVPKIYACTQGKTYTYEPNSLSVLLSYDNGAQKSEAITITAPLPSIVIKQSIRTLYDITQDGIKRLKANPQKTMDITKALLDSFKSCMEMVKILAYLTLIGTVVAGYFGYTQGGGAVATPSGTQLVSTKISSAVDAAAKAGIAGTMVMNAVAKLCEFLQTQYMIDLKVIEIENKMIQMKMCMEMNQHMMDIGRCDGREDSCFNSMISCVKFDQISSWSKDLSSIIKEGLSDLKQMDKNFKEAGDAVGAIGGYCGS